jgi:hypothetical protein
VREGEENQAAGAPGAVEQGVSAARAARTLPPDDAGELIVGGGGGRGE